MIWSQTHAAHAATQAREKPAFQSTPTGDFFDPF
jgi:hypothetical protein